MDIRNNQLHLGGVSVDDLRAQFGSPLYVYEAERLRRQFRQLKECFRELWDAQRLQIHYAMKANSNPTLLRILRAEGAHIDAVSPFEIRLARACGYASEQILFTGNSVTPEEVEYCRAHQIGFNVGSLYWLEEYGRKFPQSAISLRINPGVGAGHHAHCITGGPRSKFGIYHDQLGEIGRIVERYQLRIVGIQSHIGTGIFSAAPMLTAMDMILNVAEPFPDLEFIDFGGGFGIPYRPDQQEMDVANLGQQMTQRFHEFCENYGRDLTMKIEPGRYLVGQCGTLLTTVTMRKRTPEYQFVGTDSGFHHLVRPTMYGAYHKIWNASQMDSELETVVIVGNVCETGDFFSVDNGDIRRELPRVRVGDCLAIGDAGAYGYAMSSQYNSRPRPAEVLVQEGEVRLIRRMETYEDLLRTAEEL